MLQTFLTEAGIFFVFSALLLRTVRRLCALRLIYINILQDIIFSKTCHLICVTRFMGQAGIFEAYKQNSLARQTKSKLAWLRRKAKLIRFYLVQYVVNEFSVNYL